MPLHQAFRRTKAGKCKLAAVCQSLKPLSFWKRLYRRPEVYWYNGRMHQRLKLHPDAVCFAVAHIEVEVMRLSAGSLLLSYLVTGRISDLRIPPAVAATRTNELWRHTCFEAFICNSPGPAYYEFNFSPSTQWAAYWFDRYRSGIRVATDVSAPRIEVQSSRACYRLQAFLEIDQMSSLRMDGLSRLGLAAVIEEMSGHKSYWALAHPPGKADQGRWCFGKTPIQTFLDSKDKMIAA